MRNEPDVQTIPQGWVSIDFADPNQLSLDLKTQPAHDNRKQAAQVKKCDPGWRSNKNAVCEKQTSKPTITKPVKADKQTQNRPPISLEQKLNIERTAFLANRGKTYKAAFSDQDYIDIQNSLGGNKQLFPIARRMLDFLGLFLYNDNDNQTKVIPYIEYDMQNGKAIDYEKLGTMSSISSLDEAAAILSGPLSSKENPDKNPRLFKIEALEKISESRALARAFANLRPLEQDSVVNAIWGKLPQKVKRNFVYMGNPSRGSRTFAGFEIKDGKYVLDSEGKVIPTTIPSEQFNSDSPQAVLARENRGKEVLRLFMKQGGSDIYRADGRFILGPLGLTIDHMTPRKALQPSEEPRWDDPANWVLTRKGLNLFKSDSTLTEFFKRTGDALEKIRNLGGHEYEEARRIAFKNRSDESILITNWIEQNISSSNQYLTGNFKSDIDLLFNDFTKNTSLDISQDEKEAKKQKAQRRSKFNGQLKKIFRFAYWNSLQTAMSADRPQEKESTLKTAEILWRGVANKLKNGATVYDLAEQVSVIKYYTHYKMYSTEVRTQPKAKHYLQKARELMKDPSLSAERLERLGEVTLRGLLPNLSKEDRDYLFTPLHS